MNSVLMKLMLGFALQYLVKSVEADETIAVPERSENLAYVAVKAVK